MGATNHTTVFLYCEAPDGSVHCTLSVNDSEAVRNVSPLPARHTGNASHQSNRRRCRLCLFALLVDVMMMRSCWVMDGCGTGTVPTLVGRFCQVSLDPMVGPTVNSNPFNTKTHHFFPFLTHPSTSTTRLRVLPPPCSCLVHKRLESNPAPFRRCGPWFQFRCVWP